MCQGEERVPASGTEDAVALHLPLAPELDFERSTLTWEKFHLCSRPMWVQRTVFPDALAICPPFCTPLILLY
jgi:hypothetical protein